MVVLNKIYTRTGDRGETALGDGTRVAKHSPRVEAYGTVDELNAANIPFMVSGSRYSQESCSEIVV